MGDPALRSPMGPQAGGASALAALIARRQELQRLERRLAELVVITSQLKEENPITHNNYGNLLAKLDKNEEAERHLKRALELKEEYFKALHYDDLIAHERLIRMCFIDYDREITLVAQLKGLDEIIAIGRFTKLKNSKDGFFSLLVKDKWHKKYPSQRIHFHNRTNNTHRP